MNANLKSLAELAAETDASARAADIAEQCQSDPNRKQAIASLIEIALMQWFHRGAAAAYDEALKRLPR